MSTSANAHGTAQQAPSHARIAWHYLVAAIGCAAFAFIYAQFSHGVHSPFMTFMFAIPLAAGTLPALALHLAHAPGASRASRQAWALAIAALALGSCLHGIFDIAGTASPYVAAYPLAAAAFALTAFLKRK